MSTKLQYCDFYDCKIRVYSYLIIEMCLCYNIMFVCCHHSCGEMKVFHCRAVCFRAGEHGG